MTIFENEVCYKCDNIINVDNDDYYYDCDDDTFICEECDDEFDE